MDKPAPFIHPGRLQPQGTQPIYRYPKAHLLTAKQKQAIALDLISNGIPDRHIRKAISITARQLDKAKALKHQLQAVQEGSSNE
jgi:hypothetical protein